MSTKSVLMISCWDGERISTRRISGGISMTTQEELGTFDFFLLPLNKWWNWQSPLTWLNWQKFLGRSHATSSQLNSGSPGTRDDAVPVSMTIPEVKTSDAKLQTNIKSSFPFLNFFCVFCCCIIFCWIERKFGKSLFGLTSLLFPPHWKNSLRIPMVRSWASPFGIEPWAWGEKHNSPCDHPSSSFTWGSILVENQKTGGNSVCMSNGKKEMWWSGGCNWVDLGCAKLQTCGTSKQAKW